MGTDFAKSYSEMSDDELLNVAAQTEELLPEAADALSNELQRRHLSASAVSEYKKYLDETSEFDSESIADSQRQSPGPYAATNQILTEFPPPRPVRLSKWGKRVLVVAAAWWVVTFALNAAKFWVHPAPILGSSLFPVMGVFLIAAVLILLCLYLWQRHLLSNGEVAIARVTERIYLRSTRVRYEFRTDSGQQLHKVATDQTGKIFAGMSVPVFYDPKHPKRQIALCASL